MTNRRSFLKALAGIVASVALAQRAVMDSLTFETVTKEEKFPEVVNPAWQDAEYELSYIVHPTAFRTALLPGPFPPDLGDTQERFTFHNGEFKKVPKFLP